MRGATSFAHGTLGLSPTYRDPIIRAVSFVDNSPSSRSSIALRILGVKLAIAADRIRRRPPCKKAVSGQTRESGIFNRSAVSLFPLKSSIGTSRRPRPRLSRTPAGASSRTAYCGPRLIRSFMNNHIFPRDLDSFLLNKLPRRENVRQTDSAQQLRTNPVTHHVYDLGSILCRIDVHTERTFAERSIHNLHDCFPDRGDIRVRRNNRGKALHHIVREVFVRSVVILSDTLSIGRPAGVSEMVCSSGERARNDNGSLDAPAGEFTRGHHSQRVHPRLRCKIRCEVGRSTTGRAAARYPDHQSLLLLPQLRQSSTVDALRA